MIVTNLNLEKKTKMKITIIRHGKVNIKWPKKCNSIIFDKACKEYDLADIESVDGFHIDIDCKNIYVSNFSRSLKTAQALFPRKIILRWTI
jgi:broad specificity phosphatase PhoE